MSEHLNHQLNEHLRDALLALCLTHALPEDRILQASALKNRVVTADDLYAYWLMDVQVSQAVPTSRVASAISSLQHYINAISLGLEPGYDERGMSDIQHATWRDSLHAYSVWRTTQRLRHFPASYLSPTLRRNKTESFQQLENDIYQCRIQTDSVLPAIQRYLTRFEEIASLKTLNGYIDGNKANLAKSTYYFVGKSNVDNSYFWRSLDMSRRCLRQAKPGGPLCKQDAPQPDAWTDWKKIPLPASQNIPDHSVRPVYFNNRLFVVWAQCGSPVVATQNAEYSWPLPNEKEPDYKLRLESFLKSRFIQFRLYFMYMKYDGSWSGPQVCSDEYCVMKELNNLNKNALQQATDTIAVLDDNTYPASLFLGLNAHAGSIQTADSRTQSDFFQAVRIDHDFNTERLFSRGTLADLKPNASNEELAKRYLSLYTYNNLYNFQFHAPTSEIVAVKDVVSSTSTIKYAGWDYDSKQSFISDLTRDNDIVYNITSLALEVTTRLDKPFPEYRTIEFKARNSKTEVSLSLTLLRPAANGPDNDSGKSVLENGSHLSFTSEMAPACSWVSLAITCQKTGVTYKNLIYNKGDDDLNRVKTLELVAINNQWETKLKDKFIESDAFNFLFENTHTDYTITVNFYNEENAVTENQNPWIFDNAMATLYARHYKPVVMIPLKNNMPHPQNIHRGNTYIVGEPKTSRRELGGTLTSLSPTHTFSAHVQLKPQTLRPYEEEEDNSNAANSRPIALIYGVLILDVDTRTQERVIRGYAVKALSLTLPQKDAKSITPLAPKLTRGKTQRDGTPEFIDFSNSLIKYSDTGAVDVLRAPIRLNTGAVRQLSAAASVSLDKLFSLTASQWREPAMGDQTVSQLLDFQGAHGTYFWELFLYLPWLVASRLNTEQRYAEAEAWLTYIFDPTRMGTDQQQTPDYWRLFALTPAKAELSYARNNPDDPNQIALSAPVHFREALYRLYIDIQLNRGDAAYRQATADSLAEAKLWYVRVKNLLGPRPDSSLLDPWRPVSLQTLSNSTSRPLRQLELQIGRNATPCNEICRAPVNDTQNPLARDTSLLRLPLDPSLMARWNTVDNRLFNLRHHLSISGKPLQLSLFAPALDARTLLERYTHNTGSSAAAPGTLMPEIGHYRFQIVYAHAMTLVDNVIQLGHTLLSLFERKEQNELVQQQQQQAWELAQIAVEQQVQGMQVDNHNHKALLAGRQAIEGRMRYFEKQLKEGISSAESRASQQYLESAQWEAAASAAQAGAGLAMLVPNIFGTSNGGMRYEGAFHAIQAGAQGIANDKRSSANHLDRTEQFNRRTQEWAQALDQCRLELNQIDLQLEASTQQTSMLGIQLRHTEKAMQQARDTYELLNKRFTGAQLYQWLNNQLAAFYYQAFDAAHALCLSAQASWQYERADWNSRFIQASRWNNQFKGMSAGESLKLDLIKMNAAYLQHHQRDLEISKTVSLRQLPGKDPASTLNKDWEAQRADLITEGKAKFELTEALFEADYPDHYLRRIKSISISLPATLGPYEDIRATLTQTWSQITLSKKPVLTKDSLRVNEQIALSTGLNDSGLFTLNFDTDERYLPFEYTGAVSKWTLAFPEHTKQGALLASLTDIIVHVRYTARSTGSQG